MKKLKGTKCEFGYISSQKKFQALMLLLYIAIGVGLFLTGFLITGTRANLFTVLGILMALPGAKRVIALVVMVPRKSVEKERYDKMRSALSKESGLLTDYVFTSPDKVMNLDFVVVDQKNVMGILGKDGQDVKYMTDYLQKGIDETVSGCDVRIFFTDEDFYKFYEKRSTSETTTGDMSPDEIEEAGNEEQEEIIKYLKILAV